MDYNTSSRKLTLALNSNEHKHTSLHKISNKTNRSDMYPEDTWTKHKIRLDIYNNDLLIESTDI